MISHNPKIAVVVTHPIQHFCPMYKSWSEETDWSLKVFFGSNKGSTSYYDPYFKKELEWNNLYLESFPHVFLTENCGPQSSGHGAILNLEQELQTYDPDIVVIYGYAQKLSRIALHWSNSNGKKSLIISDGELRHQETALKRSLKSWYLKAYFKKIDGFLTVGDANEHYYKHYGVPPRKLFRSPFPIDIYTYKPLLSQKQLLSQKFREQYQIKPDEVICSMVGKLIGKKQQIKLIESLAFVQDVRIITILAGSGETMPQLEAASKQLKNHRVVFTGFLAPENLPGLYAATDIYVHTSLREPHSLAISEAVYMGCPAIISHTTGSYGSFDDVRHAINGFVYDQQNIKELGHYLQILAKNHILRESFSRESSKHGVLAQKMAHGEGLRTAINALKFFKGVL